MTNSLRREGVPFESIASLYSFSLSASKTSDTSSKGSQLFIQSDIFSIIEEMESLIFTTNCFKKIHPDNKRFIQFNPFKINTEREDYAIRKKLPIYRILFERN